MKNITLFEEHRIAELAALYRRQNKEFARWAEGYGVIAHTDLTQVRVFELAELLLQRGIISRLSDTFNIMWAVDRIASAGLWVVAHMSYAKNVRLISKPLSQEDFKPEPQGHMGGALNMVIAYAGFLGANALSGHTRAWLMGQGHCSAAIDALNVIVGNMTDAHSKRYSYTARGLSRLAEDFYSYAIHPDGSPASPLGSHVNAHTAGGLIEGGYLGFGELLYTHTPLPGESLVAFLSDGAFEEQRGSDWTPRWWRASDCGAVLPIMIANGRRIDQRSTMAQVGGVTWFGEHLRLNGFDPIDIDGRDPASFIWAIIEMEARLAILGSAAEKGEASYPVPVPYGVAEVPKGFGFPGAGTNEAHNLPLGANPATDPGARTRFNDGARNIWVSNKDVMRSIEIINNHDETSRLREKDHPIVRRDVGKARLPKPPWREADKQTRASPMMAIDTYFVTILKANRRLRPRVGNPDAMRSNQMNATLDFLKHRVTAPELGIAESTNGSVITALNEEAIVCAALANKGGINMVITYEAFAVKMLGALRQDIIFSRNQKLAGQPPGWLSVPVILTSHTWENGKNEQSHQDPTLSEVMMGEMTDVSRVVFPGDWNSALAITQEVYRSFGQIWTVVIPKRPVPCFFSKNQAKKLARTGMVVVRQAKVQAEFLIIATGAYQLEQALVASDRLRERDAEHSLIYLGEPGRFRSSRDAHEAQFLARQDTVNTSFPDSVQKRIFLTHTRPEPYLGTVRTLDTGPQNTIALGYVNRGGTLDANGMLFTNRSTWAHILEAAARLTERRRSDFLSEQELAAIDNKVEPLSVLFGLK